MAISISYSLEFVTAIDPAHITSGADATIVTGVGVAVTGNHAGHIDTSTFDAEGAGGATSLFNLGSSPSTSQLDDGPLLVASIDNDDAYYLLLTATGSSTALGLSGVIDVDAAGLFGGLFAVAYQDLSSPSDNDIFVNIRHNDGSFGTSVTVDDSGADDQAPSIAALRNGGFAIAWHRVSGANSSLYYAVYNGDGSVRKAPALYDVTGSINRNASVAALEDGGFAIAYEDNGLGGGDRDIALAVFDASGNGLAPIDISQNSSQDALPSITSLSNGMLLVGSSTPSGVIATDFDITWTLVDSESGAVLAVSSLGSTPNFDTQTSVAGMPLGRFGVFFTDAGTSDIVGQVLAAVRTSTGDAAGNLILGDELRDIVFGGAGADTIRGGANEDELHGEGGPDWLGGGDGVDLLRGGVGSDTYRVDAAGEAREQAGEGIDTVRSTVGYALGQNIERLTLLGSLDINGRGNALNNLIIGNSGENVLNGADGSDTLTGGMGADDFLFNSALDPAANVDRVTDFEIGLDDIRLDDAIFAGLTNAGRAAAFHVGTAAADSSDRIIYNPNTGVLFFDPDGTGGAAQIRFAAVDPGLALTATDLLII
ncbi:MAG TPA: calcium-binding protein [Allosphingosinicella sp.]|nr:calcium-binding protein [Allosphingosinicella sp.]